MTDSNIQSAISVKNRASITNLIGRNLNFQKTKPGNEQAA